MNNDDARAIMALVGQFGSLAWKNGYGRKQEDQADRVGLRYAYEAGYDITKGPRLWQRFARKYGEPDAVQGFFFSDHTKSSKRAEHLERELALNYPNGPKRMARPVITRRASMKVPRLANPPSGVRADSPREVTTGMTPEDVRAVLGSPGDQLSFGQTARWIYEDMTVVFESGRVTDVRF